MLCAPQHNAAFALYGLADNEDNVPDIIREGALQRLMTSMDKLQVQASKVSWRGMGLLPAAWHEDLALFDIPCYKSACLPGT